MRIYNIILNNPIFSNFFFLLNFNLTLINSSKEGIIQE